MECQVGSRGAAQELQGEAIVSFHSVCRHVHSGGGFLSKRHALNLFVPPLFAFGIEEEKGSNISTRDFAFFSGGSVLELNSGEKEKSSANGKMGRGIFRPPKHCVWQFCPDGPFG